MDYMFLIYSDSERIVNLTDAQKAERRERAWEILDEAVEKGVFKAASPLQPPNTAITARLVSGKVALTDGPFAETKEFLAGYWIIDCANEEEARGWASRLSQTSCNNTVECRAVMPIPPRPVKQSSADHQFVNA